MSKFLPYANTAIGALNLARGLYNSYYGNSYKKKPYTLKRYNAFRKYPRTGKGRYYRRYRRGSKTPQYNYKGTGIPPRMNIKNQKDSVRVRFMCTQVNWNITTADTDTNYPGKYFYKDVLVYHQGGVNGLPQLLDVSQNGPYVELYDEYRCVKVEWEFYLLDNDMETSPNKDAIVILYSAYDPDNKGKKIATFQDMLQLPHVRSTFLMPGKKYKYTLYPRYKSVADLVTANNMGKGNPEIECSGLWYDTAYFGSAVSQMFSVNGYHMYVKNAYNGMRLFCQPHITFEFRGLRGQTSYEPGP